MTDIYDKAEEIAGLIRALPDFIGGDAQKQIDSLEKEVTEYKKPYFSAINEPCKHSSFIHERLPDKLGVTCDCCGEVLAYYRYHENALENAPLGSKKELYLANLKKLNAKFGVEFCYPDDYHPDVILGDEHILGDICGMYKPD